MAGLLGLEDLQGPEDRQGPGVHPGLGDHLGLGDHHGLGLRPLLRLEGPLHPVEGVLLPGHHLVPLAAPHPRGLTIPQDSEAVRDHQLPEELGGAQAGVLEYPVQQGWSQYLYSPVGPLWYVPSLPRRLPTDHHSSSHPD